jgi:hypothetical protein
MRFLGRLIYRTVRIVCLIFLALLVYGIAIIVFRQAYGIELPNIVRWVIQHWPYWSSFHF